MHNHLYANLLTIVYSFFAVQKSHTIKNKLLDVKKAISKQEMDRHRGGDSRGMGNGYGGGYGGEFVNLIGSFIFIY